MKLQIIMLVTFVLFGCKHRSANVSEAKDYDEYGNGYSQFQLQSYTANRVFDSMQVRAQSDGGYRATKTLTGELSCTMRVPMGAPSSFWCDMPGLTQLVGLTAEDVWNAWSIQYEHDGGYHGYKRAYGTLTCTGLFPMGGRPSYECSFR